MAVWIEIVHFIDLCFNFRVLVFASSAAMMLPSSILSLLESSSLEGVFSSGTIMVAFLRLSFMELSFKRAVALEPSSKVAGTL